MARVTRAAHRCARDRLFELNLDYSDNHFRIFDYLVLEVDWEKHPQSLLYKLLDCRFWIDIYTIPPLVARGSFFVFSRWLNDQIFIVGNMENA